MSKSKQLSKTNLNIRNFNNDFLLIQAEDKSSVIGIGRQIFEQQFDFVEEVIVTEIELCLKLNEKIDDSKLNLLQALPPKPTQQSKTYKLPVYFSDHEDWATVQSTTGLEKTEIVAKLEATDFSIAMFGFLPGFLYLDGLDSTLHVPRKTVPAKYVSANSIAIGGKYVGVYAVDSPGGWHVIGQIPIPILQIPELPPVSMNLGDTINLCAISKAEFDKITAEKQTLNSYNS